MAIETPLWMQGDVGDPTSYSARADRALIDAVFQDAPLGGRLGGGLVVTQRGAGPNNSVDITEGVAVIVGTDQADQGKYIVRSTATENVAFSAAPGANSRIDLLVLQVRDPNAGGAAGFDAVLAVVVGVAAGAPVAPATPDSSLAVAHVLRTAGDVAITDAMITDVAPDATPVYVLRVTTAERDDLTAVYPGYTIFNETTEQFEIYEGPDWTPGAPVATPVDIQVFTASGTWTKPADAVLVDIHIFGAGGGGGGGHGLAAGNTRGGGGGGGGGAHVYRQMRASVLAATVAVTVGAGGTAGNGGTAGTGTAGGIGGFSGFGNAIAFGGGGGGAGTNSGNSGAAGGGGGGGSAGQGTSAVVNTGGAAGEPVYDSTKRHGTGEGGGRGASPTLSTAESPGGSGIYGGGGGGAGAFSSTWQPGGPSIIGGGGGGGGGALDAANATTTGGKGGDIRAYGTVVSGIAGGAAGTGSAGNAGTVGTASSEPWGGSGGGGGAPHNAGTGGVGGAGAIRGGGGGGGGGGTNTGGAGGVGGRGEVVVITYF